MSLTIWPIDAPSPLQHLYLNTRTPLNEAWSGLSVDSIMKLPQTAANKKQNSRKIHVIE